MSLRSRLRDLSDEAQDAVLDLFDRWQGGGLTESEFVAAAAAAIARANGRAIRTADRAAAIQLSRMYRREVRPSGDEIPDMRPRLADGVTTLLAERPEIATTAALLAASQRQRLARLARNEPLQRGTEKVQEQFARNEAGWTRAIGGDACPLCQKWDDGEVRPASVDMPRHTGCSCVQVPRPLSRVGERVEAPSPGQQVQDLMGDIEQSMARARESGAADEVAGRVTDRGFLEP